MGATTHLKQKDRQLSGQQLVKVVLSDQKVNSGLAMFWLPYFGTRMVCCLSTMLRKVKRITATITWHYWLFANQKKVLQGKRFDFNEEVIAETEASFESKDE